VRNNEQVPREEPRRESRTADRNCDAGRGEKREKYADHLFSPQRIFSKHPNPDECTAEGERKKAAERWGGGGVFEDAGNVPMSDCRERVES